MTLRARLGRSAVALVLLGGASDGVSDEGGTPAGGVIAVASNLREVASGPVLSRAVRAGTLLGEITAGQDPRIAARNPVVAARPERALARPRWLLAPGPTNAAQTAAGAGGTLGGARPPHRRSA